MSQNSFDEMMERVRQQDAEIKASLRQITEKHEADRRELLQQIQKRDAAMRAGLNAFMEKFQDDQRRLMEQIQQANQ